MPVFRSVLGGFLAILLSGSPGISQDLKDARGPAELPASDFTGRQYVDSTGCVFVRAGYGDNIVWVPRVSRDRKMICGFVPTSAPATATAAKPTPPPPPVKPASPAAPVVLTVKAAGQGSPAVQAAPVQPRSLVQKAPRSVAPKELMPNSPPPRTFRPPQGFRRAWGDDRLNQDRGPKTQQGDQQMAQIWTNDVPQRLQGDEPRKPVSIAANRERKKRPKKSPGRVKDIVDTLLLSSKSPTVGTLPQTRFVQVGAFGVPANARAVIARLEKAGLPAGVVETTIKGRSLQIVLAGPFDTQADSAAALNQVRAAGFSDAYLRK